MLEVEIQPPDEGKGRSFRATLVSYVTGDTLWFGGGSDSIRPIHCTFAGPENELRPFVANLQLGRKAESGSRRNVARFEILRSAKYHLSWQRTPAGALVTFFLPSLFQLDPGMVDPKGVTFCILPAAGWLPEPDAGALAHLAALGFDCADEKVRHAVRLAPLFMIFLDRRTRCPLIPDVRFHAQVTHAALTKGLASWSVDPTSYRERSWGQHGRFGFTEVQIDRAGYVAGIAMMTSHDHLEAFLAEQVSLFFASTDSTKETPRG